MTTPAESAEPATPRPIPPIEGRRPNRRQKRLWQLFDFSRGRGLEIGPLHNRVVYPEQADVHYLDVFDLEQLRVNYAHHVNVKKENIPEIEYVLLDQGRVRTIPETIGDDEPFDWVIASHVIEHVPDVIGWLRQVAEVTRDDGHLVLVVPDRRYCFDAHRPGTTVGQMLLEHELGATVPSIRAVFDSKRGHAGGTSAPDAWKGEPPTYERRINTLEQVMRDVDRARSGEYVDCHVWTFTSGSLVEQLIELRHMGLSDWMVEIATSAPRNRVEFFVVLRRLARGTDWSGQELPDEVPARTDMPDWLAQTSQWQRNLRASRDKLRRKQARINRLEAQLRQARAQLGQARPSLATRVRRRLRR